MILSVLVKAILALLSLGLLLQTAQPGQDPAYQQLYDALESYHLAKPARVAFVRSAMSAMQQEAEWNTDSCLPGVVEFIATGRHHPMVMNCTYTTSMSILNLVEAAKPPMLKSQLPSSKP